MVRTVTIWKPTWAWVPGMLHPDTRAYEIEQWCKKTKIGERISRWQFVFKDSKELLLFKLRWM